MCNIRYQYNKDDSFGVALQKVLRALRQDLGIKVYNFLVNTDGSSGEVDLKFLQYVAAHKQWNATNDRISMRHRYSLEGLTQRFISAMQFRKYLSDNL
jgi:hypothetical protein